MVLEGGKYLDADDVRKYLKDLRTAPEDRNLPVPVGKSVEQAERELILRALLDIKGNIMELKDLLAEPSQMFHTPGNSRTDVGYTHEIRDERTLSLQDMEHKLIAEALERYKGNRRVAARALNISERTLYRKIKEYGLG
jgi:transcriptional regulator of acetoin/glycerol metabolism